MGTQIARLIGTLRTVDGRVRVILDFEDCPFVTIPAKFWIKPLCPDSRGDYWLEVEPLLQGRVAYAASPNDEALTTEENYQSETRIRS